MRNIFKIIYLLIIIILPYLIIIYSFQVVWNKIDNLTWTSFNSNIVKKIDLLFDKIWWAKDSTDNFINNVWNNTKSKNQDKINNYDKAKK